jgi:hypothetical protein
MVKAMSHNISAGWSRSARIANGQQLSDAIENKYGRDTGVVVPAAFTGTALTFEVSADGVTFQPLHGTDGNAVSLTVAQGRSYPLPSAVLPWPHFKMKSGSVEAGARTLVVVIKG